MSFWPSTKRAEALEAELSALKEAFAEVSERNRSLNAGLESTSWGSAWWQRRFENWISGPLRSLTGWCMFMRLKP